MPFTEEFKSILRKQRRELGYDIGNIEAAIIARRLNVTVERPRKDYQFHFKRLGGDFDNE